MEGVLAGEKGKEDDGVEWRTRGRESARLLALKDVIGIGKDGESVQEMSNWRKCNLGVLHSRGAFHKVLSSFNGSSGEHGMLEKRRGEPLFFLQKNVLVLSG